MALKKLFLKSIFFIFLTRNIVTSIETKIIFSRYTTQASKSVFFTFFLIFSKDQLLLLWPKQIVARTQNTYGEIN